MGIDSLKHTTQFYTIPLWWLRISRDTRIFYAQKTWGRLTLGLKGKTRRLLVVGCKHIS
jgi:hypothetical protein